MAISVLNFFWPHIFLWFLTKFSSLCFWNNFHHTLKTLYAFFSLNMLLRSVIFENFWLFPQGGVIAVFTYPTSLPLPLPFPFQPHPSISPDTPSPSLFNPTSCPNIGKHTWGHVLGFLHLSVNGGHKKAKGWYCSNSALAINYANTFLSKRDRGILQQMQRVECQIAPYQVHVS